MVFPPGESGRADKRLIFNRYRLATGLLIAFRNPKVGGCSVKRLVLVFVVVLSGFSMPAWANTITVTLSPNSQTLPVSTSAPLTLQFQETGTGPAITSTFMISAEVLSGPDSGLFVGLLAYTFQASDIGVLHSLPFSYANNGTPGTDMVEGILIDSFPSGVNITSSPVSVNWTAAAVPEPPSFILLATGLVALVAFMRKRIPFSRSANI